MSKNESYIKQIGRVLYADPNSAFGSINGVPMTPDYSDLCISFKLECRVLSRFKNNISIAETDVTIQNKDTKKDETVKYSLNWNTPYGTIGENQWVSFMQGDLYNNNKDSSLSTYYTDLHYNDYKNTTIVEGLGVEQVTIAYENYYTPTITIKFVDHRGASLFGREESVHYDDKITIDSIFGAFFTAPYPQFRMQVKGFYGHAVTYQMTCTGFKGALNSESGNFEAIATFVGYSYSLLSDIPFEYLVAAPYCKYVGEDYWIANRTKEDWRMYWGIDGDVVPTLFELFQNINAAFYNSNLLQVISDDDKYTADVAHEEINMLYSLSSLYDTLMEMIKHRILGNGKDIDNYIIHKGISGEDGQYLYMVEDFAIQKWDDIKSTWDSFTSVLRNFNDTFKEDAIANDVVPHEPSFNMLNSIELFHIDEKNKKVSLVGVKEETLEELLKLKINGVQLNIPLCEEILERINNPELFNQFRPRVYVINWGTFKETVENEIAYLKTTVSEVNRKAERNYLHLAMENLGIVPYVGNIFKLVICHVETFIHMMHQCYINITHAEMVGQRTGEYLGISKEATDVVTKGKNIPPWPSITKSNDATNYYLMTERDDTFGWIGDFSDYFEEAKLVRALYLACQRTAADPAKSKNDKPIEYLYVPIIPSDLNDNLNPFVNGDTTLSSLGGMLGIRIAQVLGVAEENKITDTLATILGKVDALNYYRFVSDRAKIDELLTQCDGNIADVLYDIMLCKPSADKYASVVDDVIMHSFEFAKQLFSDIKRHPIFAETNSTIASYVYMPTKSHFGIVPANTRSIESYKKHITGTSETGQYFEFDYLNGEPFLHFCSATQLFSDYKESDKKNLYVNNELYKIVIDTPTLLGIKKRYEQMKTNKISVMGEEYEIDTSEMLKRYWQIENSDFNSYMMNANGFFAKSYRDNGIEDKLLLGSGFDTSSDVLSTDSDKLQKIKYAHYNTDSVKFDDGTDANINNLIIPTTDCLIDRTWYCLFGTDFYYMQNEIADIETRTKVKALLFLHTLFYNKNKTMAWDETNGHAVTRRIPFGFAALYGALIWRHQYIQKYQKDPIIYGDIYKPAYVKDGVEYSLFDVIGDNKYWVMSPKLKNESNYTYRMFAGSKDNKYVFKSMPDYMVSNELLAIFNHFISNQWKSICTLELRRNDGSEFSTGKAFSDYISQLLEDRVTALGEKEKDTPEYKLALAQSLDSASKKFASFSNNYSFLMFGLSGFQKGALKLWLNPNNTETQNALRSTYSGECIELITMSYPLILNGDSTKTAYTDIVSYVDNIKSYLNGFAVQLKSIKDKVSNDVALTTQDKQVIQDTPEFTREMALPIYMYLKSIWDKWLVAMDLTNHNFMAKNFEKNFVFMDSFYRNIASRFMMNCQLLLDCYNNVSTTSDTTAFKYLADVVNQHQLMFVGLPSFECGMVSKNLSNKRHALEAMQSIFTPMPYEQMNPIEENNRFAIVYIPGLSEIPSELNGYKKDSFDIISEDGENSQNFPDVLRDDFILEDTSMYGLYMGYGYYVPSFSIAYGSQNNHMFKNIKLSMETPIITSTVINTLSNTARIGAKNTHRVAFIGQDLYPVFSNYSYICEFEMMGCAQIQPLMYFQLMNVPMWRGTYIIFSVVHTMTPGNMVTRVKAMKLSCRVVPYSNAWFTENPNFDENEFRKRMCLDALSGGTLSLAGLTVNSGGSSDSNVPLGSAGIFTGKTKKEQHALCEASNVPAGQSINPDMIMSFEYKCGVGGKKTCKNTKGSVRGGLNKHVIADLQAIANEVAQLGWFDFNISSSWRKYNDVPSSNHRLGIAVDINAGSNGNPWFNHRFSKIEPEPKPGEKLGYSCKKYSQPPGGYDKSKCVWHYEHPVVKIFRAHGWRWGGLFGDVMHFDLSGQDT